MPDTKIRIEQSVHSIKSKTEFVPRVGIILGTGLGEFVNEFKVEISIPYAEITNFPVSTVKGHEGKLIFGYIQDVPVVAMQGRFHFYEGYSAKEITFPVRVMKFLGIKYLLISNAAGGLNEEMENGDLMIIEDHINFQPENPLRGFNDDTLGPRFPDMSESYSQVLIKQAEVFAKENNIKYIKGIYLGLQGPNLETKAEYKAFNRLGADAIGMSTVPEVLVANHMGIPCFAVSVITNVCYPPHRVKETTHEDVIEVAATAEPKLTSIFKALIKTL
jgi:purine-nucleoside phosphorylase